MGLIKCPHCGGVVSDKAAACPHCSFIISKQSSTKLVSCDDCGNEYDITLTSCPECGCPNLINNVKTKNNKRTSILFLAILIIVLILGGLGLGILKAAEKNEYYINMVTIVDKMSNGVPETETAGILIMRVWHNSIYRKQNSETDKFTMNNGKFVDEFNTALANLFADEEFRKSISEINKNKSEATALMKKLQNPPKEYEEAYSALNSCYSNYLKMINLVITANGSYNTFSNDFNTYDTALLDSFDKMQLYLQ